MVWSNKNLEYVFKRMFQCAIDFPIDIWPNFEEYELWNINEFKRDQEMKKQLYSAKKEFFDFYKWTHRVDYETLYEPWFINILFGES